MSYFLSVFEESDFPYGPLEAHELSARPLKIPILPFTNHFFQ